MIIEEKLKEGRKSSKKIKDLIQESKHLKIKLMKKIQILIITIIQAL